MSNGRTQGASQAVRQLKGLARAVRAAVFRVSQHECLSRDAEEEMFRHADVLSEGHVAGNRFEGSTMISVDLERMAGFFREPIDEHTAERLRMAMERSVRVHLRAIRIARQESLRRVDGAELGTAEAEVNVRVRGLKLHIDVDLEAPVK